MPSEKERRSCKRHTKGTAARYNSRAMLDEGSPLSFAEWFESAVARCQVFIGTQTPTEFDIVTVASTFVQSLPDARCPAEDLLLRSLLLDVADRWGTSVHADLHQRPNSQPCGFDPTSTLREFLRARGNAKHSFMEWARCFCVEFHRIHPLSPARRAAAIIRDQAERSDASALATSLGVTPRQLRRAFLQTFGVPLPEYLRRARLLRALELMTEQPGKVEPVALDVGYRSKKDFYRVFRQFIGMTPTDFKKLPRESALRLIDRTRAYLGRKRPTATRSSSGRLAGTSSGGAPSASG
jgi:AraC-like DNA-binding protein